MGKSEVAPPPPKRRGLRRAVKTVLILGLLAVVLLPVVTALAVIYVGGQDVRRVSDVIVVLGSAQDDGEPREVLSARLDHALELYNDGIADTIMTVGGKAPGDRFTEAEAGRDYLLDRGVPRSDIAVVSSGRNTLGSLKSAARIMNDKGWCTAVLVSDPWHMLRSRTMARDLGMDAVTSPTQTGPTQSLRVLPRYVVRETAGLLYFLGLQSRSTTTVVTGCG
jgi:uncharacterized SAM-binding protein YcdF (DUF218 family)